MPKTPPRAWQRMLSGRRLDLLNPSPFDIEIEDIARGLARVARSKFPHLLLQQNGLPPSSMMPQNTSSAI